LYTAAVREQPHHYDNSLGEQQMMILLSSFWQFVDIRWENFHNVW